MITQDTLYRLALHKGDDVDGETYVFRVPGGWIYKFFNDNGEVSSSTFVPFHNEFQIVEKQDAI